MRRTTAATGRRALLSSSVLALALVGFRCPGAAPTPGTSDRAAGVGGGTAGGDPVGGAPPGCPAILGVRDVVEEPKDALTGEAITFEVDLDPQAEAHVVTVVDELGDVAFTAPVETPVVVVPALGPGAFSATVTASGGGCTLSEATTRRFYVCGTMWSTSSLPVEVFNQPAVVAGGQVVTLSAELTGTDDGGILTADVEPDGSLADWVMETDSITLGLAAGTRAAAATAVAAGGGAGTRIWFLGGNDGSGFLGAVRSVVTQGPESLALPPVGILSDAPLPVPTIDGASVALDGWLLFIGGFVGSTSTSSIYGRPLAADGMLGESWITLDDHPEHDCDFCTAVSVDGHVYVMGGERNNQNQGREVFDTVVRATLDSNTMSLSWSSEPPLPARRSGAGAAVDRTHRRIYVVGGGSSMEVSTPDVFVADLDEDGSVSTWEASAPLPVPVFEHGLVWTEGHLHVIGGGDTAQEVFSLALGGPDGTPVCPASVQ